MKNTFFLYCIIFTSICFGQTKSDSIQIELDIIISDQDTDKPIVGANGIIIRNDSLQIEFTTNTEGRFMLKSSDYNGFLAVGFTYEIIMQEDQKNWTNCVDRFSTKDIQTNTRIIRDLKILHLLRHYRFPEIIFAPKSAAIDSTVLIAINDWAYFFINNPTLVVKMFVRYESNKTELAWQRALVVQQKLAELGISEDRLILEIEPTPIEREIDPLYPDMHRTAPKSDVIFKILSFDYIPTPP